MKAVKIKESPDYYVTDTGCLYSRKNGRFRKLKLKPTHDGYFLARFQKTGKERIVLGIHRLVAQTFIPNPDNKPEVNHKDGNKANNNVSNLEWVTHGENIKHSYDFLGRKHGMLGRKGKNSSYSKKIQQIKDNKVIAEFWGCFEAERITGVFAPNIWACLKNKRKTAGGYLWQYATEQ